MSMEEMLKELLNVRVELLDDDSKLLFEAIMREFDKRDNYKQGLEELKDKLYCWGEALDPIFQNGCLEIIDKLGV